MELNLNYLTSKVSRRLHTVVRIIDFGCRVISKTCLRMDMDDTEVFEELLKQSIINEYINENTVVPYLFSLNNSFIYSLVKVESNLIVVGPLLYSENYSLKNNFELKLEEEKCNAVNTVLEPALWDKKDKKSLQENPGRRIRYRQALGQACCFSFSPEKIGRASCRERVCQYV